MPLVSVRYSPLEHLASIVFPWWIERREGLFMMATAAWTAAFDGGGDESTVALTVAGFVSSTKDWDDFSRLWKERLDAEGIQYFRAVEAAHFRKQFQPWHNKPDREQWRKHLFADLMDILKSHVYRKFACTILNKNFSTLSEENRKHYKLRAYSVAGRTCDKHIRDWMRDERIKVPIELVFEAGYEGDTELQIRLITDTGRAPIFRPKKDTIMKDGRL